MSSQPPFQAKGLENQLRGMILSNATSKDESSSSTPRKKPNQAQRRQMNTQLSIPIDSSAPRGPQSSRDFYNGAQHRVAGYNGPPSAPMPQSNTYHQPPRQQHPQPGEFTRWSNTPRFGFNAGQSSPANQANGRAVYQHDMSRGQPNSRAQGFPAQPQYAQRLPNQHDRLFNPHASHSNYRSPPFMSKEQVDAQSNMLERLLHDFASTSTVDLETVSAMEGFRAELETVCRDAITTHEIEDLGNERFDPSTVQLKCFGSMATGFASQQSDMDLALLSPCSDPSPDSDASKIPRLLEKILLDRHIGARLLSKTRVPIIKICQRPTSKLLRDLCESRAKWDAGRDEDVEETEGEHDDGQEESAQQASGDMQNQNTSTEQEATEAVNFKAPSALSSRNISIEETLLASFAQKQGESFANYYSSAKRLLHKLGGEDIRPQRELSLDKIEIMSKVSKAFVKGLSSHELKTRLLLQPSMDFVRITHPTTFRSLSGVYTQIEGERLVMAWSRVAAWLEMIAKGLDVDQQGQIVVPAQTPVTRIVVSPDIRDRIERQLDNWQKTCRRVDLDPFQMNRYLTKTTQQLRSIPILQLLTLEQGSQEHPEAYAFRARKICDEHGRLTVQDNIEVAKLYAAGINDEEIRSQLCAAIQELSSSRDVNVSEPSIKSNGVFPITLDMVAACHHILALAAAYTATEGHYTEEEAMHITVYVRTITEHPNPISSLTATTWDRLGSTLQQLAIIPDPLCESSGKKSRARDRYHDALAFPTGDIGIQCDVNFSAQLALHNTLLLRCYSLTDPRVKPFILFIKQWAKIRGINTTYRGTLSSYGYVLMALHYLVNIAQPLVCPNLQITKREPPNWLSPADREAQSTCLGRDVRFWRNEHEISDLARRGMLNHNRDSLGFLLRGFFEYYAQSQMMSTSNMRGFDWGRDVLSLRVQGGILTKSFKGWTGARTETVPLGDGQVPSLDTKTEGDALGAAMETMAITGDSPVTATPPRQTQKIQAEKSETKEIRHKYLLAIEDPFELDHNVARTVNHDGICLIRDEFRRAWRLIKEAGNGQSAQAEGLLDVKVNEEWKARELSEVFEGWRGIFSWGTR